ncbi:MAG: hypothetical protein M5U28_12315 [Sandaracinaceae bacterium]|nr:hypothetical protein [Sandaracinaceae bacterium]
MTQEIDLDPCGAHPYVEASAFVWDLAAAERAELLTERERELLAEREARRALGELARRSEVEDVRLVAIEPRWTASRLTLAYRFVADVCRACGDGERGSQALAARVDASALPRAGRGARARAALGEGGGRGGGGSHARGLHAGGAPCARTGARRAAPVT